MEYCSYVVNNYVICECGENFNSEELLNEHLENGHSSNKSVEDSSVVESEPETLYYFSNDNVVMEEWVVDDVTVTEEKPYNKDEEMPAGYSVSPQICIKIPKLAPDESAKVMDFKIEQKHFESTVNPVIFKEETILQQHVIIKDENTEHCYEKLPVELKQILYCEVCGRTFEKEQSLSRHLSLMHSIEYVTQERPTRRPNSDQKQTAKKKSIKLNVECETCGKLFWSKSHLRYHMRTHTGEKPFPCPWCDKRFAMKLLLQGHMRTHTGERPYGCETCDKRFTTPAGLARHKLVHTGEKPYECPRCGKRFNQSNARKMHILTVHEGMPWPRRHRQGARGAGARGAGARRGREASRTIPQGSRKKGAVEVDARESEDSEECQESESYVVPDYEETEECYVYEEILATGNARIQ